MLSLSSMMHKVFSTASNPPSSCWHDPVAHPAASILVSAPKIPHNVGVRWWDADTMAVLGLILSPELPNGLSYFAGFARAFGCSVVIPEPESEVEGGISPCSSLSDVSEDSWVSTWDEVEDTFQLCFAEDGEPEVFGTGRPLKRVSTITRAVGVAKRKRRNMRCKRQNSVVRRLYDAEPLKCWCEAHKMHIVHVLTDILEEEEEGDEY